MVKMNRSIDASKTNSSKSIAVEPDEHIYVGVDTHKHSHHVALWSLERQCVIGDWVQPADGEALMRRLESIRTQIVRIVYEAGPTGFCLARMLRSQGFPVEVVSPGHTPQTPVRDAKSDRLDARKLAEFGAKGLLRPVRIPSEHEEQDRQVVRLRVQVMRLLKRAKQHIKALLLYHGIDEPEGLSHWTKGSLEQLRTMDLPCEIRFTLNIYLEHLSSAQSQIARIEATMTLIASKPENKERFCAATSAPGVGLVTGLTLVCEMPEPERFNSSREVSKYQGLAPEVRSSGQQRKEGPLMRNGNRHLRRSLVEAAWQVVRRDPRVTERYRRLLCNTGDKKKAIVGVARWLGIVLWRMMVRKEEYRSDPTQAMAAAG